MNTERDELLRLIQELPDDQAPQALADVRRHLRPVQSNGCPPPAFFASASGDGSRIAELLREGFGRQ